MNSTLTTLYLSGVGVEIDVKRGLELWGKGGKVSECEVREFVEFSNDRYVFGEKLDLGGLFLKKGGMIE